MLVLQPPTPTACDELGPAPRRRRILTPILAIAALALSILFLAPQPADANLGFGGGGGFCPAEFQSCSPGDSWCTWYGWCGADSGGGFGGGFGGGGGGGSTPTADINCGMVGTGQVVDAWLVIDLGTCPTQLICRAKRNAINAGRPAIGRAYCWANWNIPNSNGRHLVFAEPANGLDDSDIDVGPGIDPEIGVGY